MAFEDGYDYDSFFLGIAKKAGGAYDPELIWVTVNRGKYVIEIAADADIVSVTCVIENATLAELAKFNGRGHVVFSRDAQGYILARAVMPVKLGQGWDALVEKEALSALHEISVIVDALG